MLTQGDLGYDQNLFRKRYHFIKSHDYHEAFSVNGKPVQ